MPKAPKGARINREGSKRTPKGSQSKPTGWHVEPKGCQKGAKGAPRMDSKIDVRKRLQMGPLPESNFPYKTGGKLHIFIFFKVFYKKLILWKYVFYTVNIRFFEVPGSHRLMLFGVILGPFSINNLIKNRCKNRCRKSDEI